jgi:hypothetical protein
MKATQVSVNWPTSIKKEMTFLSRRKADSSIFCHKENEDTLRGCHVCKSKGEPTGSIQGG